MWQPAKDKRSFSPRQCRQSSTSPQIQRLHGSGEYGQRCVPFTGPDRRHPCPPRAPSPPPSDSPSDGPDPSPRARRWRRRAPHRTRRRTTGRIRFVWENGESTRGPHTLGWFSTPRWYTRVYNMIILVGVRLLQPHKFYRNSISLRA